MEYIAMAVIAAGVLAFALASQKLEASILTLPIVFTGFGWLIGQGGLGIVSLSPSHGVIHAIAEFTLILVLFSDAARINLKRLLGEHKLSQRLLLVGLPLTVAAGTLCAWLVFPDATLASAFVVAAILSPTDAALGQTVVTSPAVPIKVRQALNVESGLNDGIMVPVVLVAAILAGSAAGADHTATSIVSFAAAQIVLGPIAGLAVGYAGARLIEMAIQRDWMSGPFQGIANLATAVLAFAVAESVGGNGFISAFVSGLVFGATIQHHGEALLEFMESEGRLLTLLTFLIFGAVMIPEALHHATWGTLLVSVLFLSVVRMVPVALSLAGLGLSMPTKLFIGWFGPRGLASILFALLILERYPIAGSEEIFACVVLTVALSVLLHGLTSAPLAAAFGAFIERRGECAETAMVSQMPTRHR